MNFGSFERVTLPGSERRPPDATHVAAFARSDEGASRPIRVTIVVRPKAAFEPGGEPMTRDAFAADYGASIDDVLAVQRFAIDAGAIVIETSLAQRSVLIEAPLGVLAELFEADLGWYESDGQHFRGRSGTLTIPRSLDGIIVGVFGIDNRPQARTQFRPAAAAPVSFTPPQIARAYGFPSDVDGTGQTIALIELGGGYVQADLDAYFAGLGVKAPAISAVPVLGGANAPTNDPSGPDGEVMLDIEVAGAIATGAKIVVYFAPNTDQGFLGAVSAAIHDTANAPTVVSISWGGPESSWTAQATSAFDAALAEAGALGVTVTVAAGDGGSSDGVNDGRAHVDFPASSPNVLACGGTALKVNGAAIVSESVWNDGARGGATGGGISDTFALPAYQSAAHVPPSANAGRRVGRGVPDVAGNADPATGYVVRVDGTQTVVGGTSAVAPLWAALIALLNQKRGKPLGFLNTSLYALATSTPAAFRDIVDGNNGAYAASPGWDACTGLGSPNGSALVAALAAPVPPPPTSPPAAAAHEG
jgi:kumamolisin